VGSLDDTLLPSAEETLPSTDGPSLGASPSPSDRREHVIDRYVVLSKLGAGAMGVVHAAYDPQLDRKVAIKLLKSLGPSSEVARTRLQREAQALAKLDHRNVVSVHDVGVHDGELFVAMELVVGRTLREWMQATKTPRPWREVVQVLSEAGRGLAAAHGANLVHRDFKPDNVMIGDDGRVRVMDFGLARIQTDAAHSVSTDSNPELAFDGEPSDTLTRTGLLMGTPAYMSPEQLGGRVADARSDQFSFCVSLYEALYGERPFRGDTLMMLVGALERGEIATPPPGTRAPAWLRKVVVRGLSRDPEQRYESMDALLDALAADPALRRRQWAMGIGLTGLLGAAVWGLARTTEVSEPCVGLDAPLAGVWDPTRQAVLRAAFDAVELPYAERTRDKVVLGLDDYAQRWVAARVDACIRTQRGEQSGELLDLRMTCLDERLQHLDALVGVLTEADPVVVGRAIQAVVGLPRLERCADVEALTADTPPQLEDAEVATQVAALDARLITARALEEAGKYTEGLALADAVVVEQADIDHPPLRARALLRQGQLQYLAGNAETAAGTLASAYDVALGQRDLEIAADASTQLVWIVGYGLARHEIGRTWAASAGPLARVLEDDHQQGKYFHSLASVTLAEGKLDEARALFERAIDVLERELGPEHLAVAEPLSGLAISVGQQGEHAKARAYLKRALAIQEAVLGPGHPNLANLLNNLGTMAGRQGDLGAAHVYLERALAIQEATLGPGHRNLAAPLDNLGALAQLEQDREGARRYLERALAIRERTLGPEHPSVARTIDNLASIAMNEGRLEDARGLYQRSLAISEASQGPDHPDLAYPLLGLGNSLHALGDAKAALPHLERAVALRTAHEVDPLELALARFGLADALADISQLDRARSLAEQARATMVEAGEGQATQVEQIDAWLAAHPE
jgi:tetratricopeptide (TPR) repeat protein